MSPLDADELERLRRRLADAGDLIERLRRDRVAQQAEIDELRAWKSTVITEAVKWAERDIVPMLISDLQNFVSVSTASYDERTRSLHLAAGAVKALESDLQTARAYAARLRAVLDRCSSCRARMALGSFRE